MFDQKAILEELLEADLAAEDLATVTLLRELDWADEEIKAIDQSALQSKIMAAIANVDIEDMKAESAEEAAKYRKTAVMTNLLWTVQKTKMQTD